MIRALAQECARWLNMFPPMGGISTYYSPLAILMGRILDYEKHCKIPFGSYVQAIQENNPTNTLKPRTLGCIFLRPRISDHVNYELMNLTTGKLITRRKVMVIPMTEEVIKQVEHFGKRDGIKEDIIFKDRKGIIMDDTDGSTIAGVDNLVLLEDSTCLLYTSPSPRDA